jgi:small-conductance mechanosensitive channel
MTDLIKKAKNNLKIPIFLLTGVIILWLSFFFFETPTIVTRLTHKSMTILVILLLAWISVLFVKLGKYLILKQYDMDQKNNLSARKVYTQFKILENIIVFVIILIAISSVLLTFSEIRKIGISILASAGVTGIILGLAAQKIISGVFSGIQLAITQPISIDDVVIVENEWGNIEEINLTYVVVKIWDERRLILPTSYFMEKPFQNWTRTNSDILGTVFLYTDYNVPFDELRKEQTRLLQNNHLWDGKVNIIQVTDSTEKSVEIRILVSAVDSPTAWDLRVFLRENMISFLQKNYPDSLPKSRMVISNESPIKF